MRGWWAHDARHAEPAPRVVELQLAEVVVAGVAAALHLVQVPRRDEDDDARRAVDAWVLKAAKWAPLGRPRGHDTDPQKEPSGSVALLESQACRGNKAGLARSAALQMPSLSQHAVDAIDHLPSDVAHHLLLVEPRLQPLARQSFEHLLHARVVVAAELVRAPCAEAERLA